MLLTFAVGATVGYTAKEARPDAIVREIHEVRVEPGAPVVIHDPCQQPEPVALELPAQPEIRRITVAETQAEVPVQPEGVLEGVVRDRNSGEKLVGATVVATSKVSATQTAITDNDGHWKLSGLPSASYDLTFYYADATGKLDGVAVSELDTRTADYSLDTTPPPVIVTFSGSE